MPKKASIVWIQGITCNGNSHSFFNYPYMDSFLDDFEFFYHPLLPKCKEFLEVLQIDEDFDFLIVEGSFCKDKSIISRHGFSMEQILENLTKRANYIICAGTCSSYGGIFAQRDEMKITGAIFTGEEKGGFWDNDFKSKSGMSVVNIPGCPLHPKWLVETMNLLKNNFTCKLDNLNRPVEIFSYLAHHGCVRNEYFEWKVDCEDFGHKEGCLFYEQGCQGPMTYANCNKILWNEINSKTRNGSPCFGCTNPTFPKDKLYKTQKYMSLPATPVGISKRAYYALSGVAKGFHIERLTRKLIDEDDS